MTAVKYVGGLIRGTNAERIALSTTNLRAGWLFVCSDTLDIYYWTGSAWTVITNATGEANTASNVGAGQGVWKAKTGVDLSFRSLTTTSSKIALANNTNDIGIDVTEANLTLSNMTGPLSIAKGGTGAATATLGFDALSAMTTAGDTQYGGASGTRTRLAIGTANQLLRTNSGATAPEWASTLSGLTLTSPTVNTPTIKYTDITKVTGDSPYTIAAGDDTIRANASGGALTVTLPTAVSIAGKKYTIKRTDILTSSVLVTIATTSSQTISSAPAQYLWPGEQITVISDGANWEEINRIHTSGQHNFMLKGTSASRAYVAGSLDMAIGLTTSTTSLALNTLWAIPFPVPQTTKFDIITFRITTASTAGNSRAGIYRDNGNCYPGTLIFDTGSIDTHTAAGGMDTTITAGLQVLPRGLYWLAYEQDTATGQMVGLNSSTNWSILGYPKALNAASGFAYSVAHTYGALPDPYTASATILNASPSASAPIPAIALRPI